ncbi:MAG TPA: hypothetical protein VN802_17755 [Stellaceae bacterium]|nr:hypothetical protein [Stellaceae bacterium]
MTVRLAAVIAALFLCGAGAPTDNAAPPSPPLDQRDILPGTEPPLDHSPEPPRISPARLPPPAPMPAPLIQAAPAPNYAPGLPSGPVTNYGTGGMQAPPGAPPNPPYPPGGLMH